MCLAPFPNEAADIDKSSRLDETYKADLVKIDTNKDGKISSAEFTSAMKSGVIK